MKLSLSVLRRFVALPASADEVRDLLDDVGVEVKRADGDLFTVELLANRGDHHCYEGVAREVSLRTGAPVRTPTVASLAVGAGPAVAVETPGALVYTLTRLTRAGAEAPLSADDAAPLVAAGLDGIGAAVDATNLVNLELGQPTHAFDADAVRGVVRVRESAPGERAWPLFRPGPVELPAGTLVIADDEKVLAIAGVIGCEESKTTAATTALLLESACFDPVKVRLASRALGIHTDSTARFERGSDPARALVGAGRVVHLLEGAGWARVGPTTQAGAWQDPQRVLRVDVAAARRFLGVDLRFDDMVARLARAGFAELGTPADRAAEALVLRVPSWRLWDVEHAADLYEELAKSIGYNAIPTTLPAVDMGALPAPADVARDAVDAVLLAAGFHEVFTDGFHARALDEALGLPAGHVLLQHVETRNALDRAYSLLKTNGFAQAIEAVAANLRFKAEAVRLFEWTRSFHPVAGADPLVPRGPAAPPCTERRFCWGVVVGDERPRGWGPPPRPADVFFVKGLLEEIGVSLRLPLAVGPLPPDAPLAAVLHPTRAAGLFLDGVLVGSFGEAHPRVLRAFKIKKERPVYFELDAALLDAAPRPGRFRDPASTQAMERALAFTLPWGFGAQVVAGTLRAAGAGWLDAADPVDTYDHTDATGAPVRTVTYRLRVEQPPAGFTAETLNERVRALVDAVAAAHGAAGVHLR